MSKEAQVLYRVSWRRQGWSVGRKSNEIVRTKTAALKKVAKLSHATIAYDVSPVEDVTIEVGTVHWSPHIVPLTESVQAAVEKQPEPKVALAEPVEKDRATIDAENERVRKMMERAAQLEAEDAANGLTGWEDR